MTILLQLHSIFPQYFPRNMQELVRVHRKKENRSSDIPPSSDHADHNGSIPSTSSVMVVRASAVFVVAAKNGDIATHPCCCGPCWYRCYDLYSYLNGSPLRSRLPRLPPL